MVERFDLWLKNHELNAQRAFGFKITNTVFIRGLFTKGFERGNWNIRKNIHHIENIENLVWKIIFSISKYNINVYYTIYFLYLLLKMHQSTNNKTTKSFVFFQRSSWLGWAKSKF